MKKSYLLLALLFLAGCRQIKDEGAIHGAIKEVPPSYISFRIAFPATEIEQGVNKIIPDVLLNEEVDINGGDHLFLKIIRIGDLDLTIRRTTAYASIPLKFSVALTKNILGMKISNRDSPIEFSGRVRVSSEISLKDDWNLDLNCHWQGIEWNEKPVITLLGMSFDLSETISRVIEDNNEKISSLLCNHLEKSIDLRHHLSKVWNQVQQPLKIAKEPVSLWMLFKPEVLNGELIAYERDTLAIHLEWRSGIYISHSKPFLENDLTELPRRSKPLNTIPNLSAQVMLSMPMQFVSDQIALELEGRAFEYRGYQLEVEEIDVSGHGQKIAVRLNVSGDLEGVIHLRGRPSISEEMVLSLEDIDYQIETKNKWVMITDFLLHPMIKSYFGDIVNIEVKELLLDLDSLAMAGIEKTELGEKIDPNLEFRQFYSTQIAITETELQWVIGVEGDVLLTLKRGLIQKR